VFNQRYFVTTVAFTIYSLAIVVQKLVQLSFLLLRQLSVNFPA
jgi:hypothetical protein